MNDAEELKPKLLVLVLKSCWIKVLPATEKQNWKCILLLVSQPLSHFAQVAHFKWLGIQNLMNSFLICRKYFLFKHSSNYKFFIQAKNLQTAAYLKQGWNLLNCCCLKKKSVSGTPMFYRFGKQLIPLFIFL